MGNFWYRLGPYLSAGVDAVEGLATTVRDYKGAGMDCNIPKASSLETFGGPETTIALMEERVGVGRSDEESTNPDNDNSYKDILGEIMYLHWPPGTRQTT